VSLVFNRGASFSRPGDRFREMRAIKAHMAGEAFGKIPSELRSMKRLWPDSSGLRRRREDEARLFEEGLTTV
jgi:GH24 family phage-related lysozyme (muramidase)